MTITCLLVDHHHHRQEHIDGSDKALAQLTRWISPTYYVYCFTCLLIPTFYRGIQGGLNHIEIYIQTLFSTDSVVLAIAHGVRGTRGPAVPV